MKSGYGSHRACSEGDQAHLNRLLNYLFFSFVVEMSLIKLSRSSRSWLIKYSLRFFRRMKTEKAYPMKRYEWR